MTSDFTILGNELEAAAHRLSASTRHRRRLALPTLVVGGVVAVCGTALAAGLIDLPGPVALPTGASYHRGQSITLPDGRHCIVDLKVSADVAQVGDHRCFVLPTPPNKTQPPSSSRVR